MKDLKEKLKHLVEVEKTQSRMVTEAKENLKNSKKVVDDLYNNNSLDDLETLREYIAFFDKAVRIYKEETDYYRSLLEDIGEVEAKIRREEKIQSLK